MDFYGTMIISPINRQPFVMVADWKYKNGTWYGDGDSFPESICKRSEDVSNVKAGRLLMEIGINPSLSGYKYLKSSIELVMTGEKNWVRITKVLYPSVAKIYKTTPERVERGIRHAIEKAFLSGDIELLHDILPFYKKNRGCPTNSEFIASVVEYMKMGGAINGLPMHQDQ